MTDTDLRTLVDYMSRMWMPLTIKEAYDKAVDYLEDVDEHTQVLTVTEDSYEASPETHTMWGV